MFRVLHWPSVFLFLNKLNDDDDKHSADNVHFNHCMNWATKDKGFKKEMCAFSTFFYFLNVKCYILVHFAHFLSR